MNSLSSQKLADFVKPLIDQGGFIVDSIDGSYNHMGQTVADAVLQANLRYETHVVPRVNKILPNYPEARTVSAVFELRSSVPTTKFLSWRGIDRANRFDAIIDLFKSENIETENDLKDRFLSAQHENLENKLRSIKGIGPKTVDYFKILVGIPASAIDRHLLNFLEEAGIHNSNYNEAQAIINDTADNLQIDRAIFDHSIWHYMSNRPKVSPLDLCKDK